MDENSDRQTALVVEDDQALANAISKKLKLSGFNAKTAKTVDDAITVLSDKGPVDVIWLDHYLLGGKDGLDLAETVKSHKGWDSIPVYVVSNTASSDKVAIYNQLGVARFYVKADHRLDEIISDIKSDVDQES